ncbi:MAG TPA: ROK family protein [Segeticoccus sp.]|uniref:polyphosphate--glucose phosphotransferase n=1 Tax=Segeticoccus sp. TaxID=2706531 RepID=UPI002D802A86|nr:ROK family protein [Segeticoccus sp.]HET8600675.1 ROK family protein [Segeticoccus sp.]
MTRLVLGIDVGGSGIKGAPVDLDRGAFAAERLRLPTPEGARPAEVADVIGRICAHFADVLDGDDVPVGVTVPGVVTHGVVRSAANIHPSWVGTDADRLFSGRLGRRVVVVNDADAAGLAELRHGAAKGHDGLVIVTTLGTGIGSALLHRGALVPNSELGHLEIDGHDAESRAADSAREREDLSWQEWAQRLQRYYSVVEDLFWPDLLVVGGGVSKKADKFLPHLHLRAPIVPATLRNAAGIIGAAQLAAES